MASGKGALERIRRAVFTVFFMLTMLASLLVLSAPVLVAVGDVAASLGLASRFSCAGCYGPREHLRRYGFRSSLMDIPLLSVVRSLIITGVYSFYEGPGISSEPYLGTATFCSSLSILLLCVKACLFTPIMDTDDGITSTLARQKLHLRKSWAMPMLFLSSLVFALGHVVVAYRATCRARRKMLFHRLDPEAVLACKSVFPGYHKVPRSPTPSIGKNSKSDDETKRKGLVRYGHDLLPISVLADVDSLFIACQGLIVHYKLSLSESPRSLVSSPFSESSTSSSSGSSSPHVSPGQIRVSRPFTVTPKIRSFSNHCQDSSLYAPLLSGSPMSPTYHSNEIPALILDDGNCNICMPNPTNIDVDVENGGKFGIVLVHGFGGGVYSWRHVTGALARQIGCPVVAFDRPGWGLTSRPRRKDWEKQQLPNPYKLESQVDILLAFCAGLGFSSVVLIGHDDGGLLSLMAAQKVRSAADSMHVGIKGIVLLSVSLSREVVPAFARILLHTSLGKKHMVRPLLRTEISQVINRRAWYDSTKLTAEVSNLYKAPLFVEGWDEALHEIGRLSFATVLSPQNADTLLNSVEDLPVLVVTGAEDALVQLKSVQAVASKLANSRLVAISGCGHLPHEECPKALLAALSPFITRLLSSLDTTQRR